MYLGKSYLHGTRLPNVFEVVKCYNYDRFLFDYTCDINYSSGFRDNLLWDKYLDVV